MVFLPTCATVDYWSDAFPSVLPDGARLPVMAIHGKMKERRKRVMEKFRKEPRAILLCTDVLARGIDVPEVDWVIQWDPPASASAFVHRVGRTARQGHEGSALIFLLPSEEAYVDFIERNQRVKLNRLPNETTDDMRRRVVDTVRKLQMNNRAVMDKASRAFVSHIRAYSKHECSLLLRVKDLPLAAMATGYGLLQLPKMPELNKIDTSDFSPVDIDLNTIPYRDKQRELIRLKKLEEYKSSGRWPGKKIAPKKQTESWSVTKQNKLERQEKRAKRKAKKGRREGEPVKKKRKKGITQEDLTELAKDIALMKKLKKKKITEEEFDEEMGIVI